MLGLRASPLSLLILAGIDLGRNAVDLVYPYRTWPRVLVRLLINVVWLVAFVLVFRTDGLLTVVATDVVRLVRR